MFKIIFLFAFVPLVKGGFFDLTDVEDPLALFWNLPNNVHKKLSECIIDRTRSGVCMDNAKCLFTGGTPSGHCGLMFTCCSYEQTCVKSSDQRQSYFEVTDLNDAVTNCKYTIKLRNKNVCQVRLDFEELTLAAAMSTVWVQEQQNIYRCSNDELRITPNYYGVPVLCGNNTNQHLYIHVNQSTDTDKAVNIDINLASRLNENNKKYLPKPTWRIKFTQLECPLKKNKFDIFKYTDIDVINNDFNILAPQGAIQYFTESEGEIKSFGLNTTTPPETKDQTSYPYLEHYTIAFKRPSNVCGIKFSTVKLHLLAINENTCDHYLTIPEVYKLQVNSLTEQTKICYTTDPNQYFSFSPGPFYLNFNAMSTTNDGPTTNDPSHQGFQFNYELLSNCPLVS